MPGTVTVTVTRRRTVSQSDIPLFSGLPKRRCPFVCDRQLRFPREGAERSGDGCQYSFDRLNLVHLRTKCGRNRYGNHIQNRRRSKAPHSRCGRRPLASCEFERCSCQFDTMAKGLRVRKDSSAATVDVVADTTGKIVHVTWNEHVIKPGDCVSVKSAYEGASGARSPWALLARSTFFRKKRPRGRTSIGSAVHIKQVRSRVVAGSRRRSLSPRRPLQSDPACPPTV